jgi:5-methylthioribose kinase
MIDLYNEHIKRIEYISGLCLEKFNFRVNEDNIQFVDNGLLNYVFKVSLPDGNGTVYVKQALKETKEHLRLSDLLRNISPKRIQAENNAINLLKNLFPAQIKIPEIIRYDDHNNIIVLSDVEGNGGKQLTTELKAGIFDQNTASLTGLFLGRLHGSTFYGNYIIRGSKNIDKINWKFWLELRTINIDKQKTILSPVVNARINDLYRSSFHEFSSDVVVMMDCHPGNIFHRANNEIGVIDFELASGTGDMAYDIGFLLGHYMISALIHKWPDNAIECIQSIWSSYVSETKSIINQSGFESFENRTVQFASSVLLYRSIGGSIDKDLNEKESDLLVKKGSELLSTPELNLNKALDILQK